MSCTAQKRSCRTCTTHFETEGESPMMFRLSSTIAAFGCLAMGIASADPAPLVAQKPVVIPGGPGAFDFMAVDAPMHHVFATHKGTKTAAVVDLQTDTALPSP